MNEKIIKKLLIADIKHNQLINGLYNIGLIENDKQILNLNLIEVEIFGFKNANIYA